MTVSGRRVSQVCEMRVTMMARENELVARSPPGFCWALADRSQVRNGLSAMDRFVRE